MRKLFISFSGTLLALHSGNATEADLAEGLFYFGCDRDHAINPGTESHGCDERRWLDRENPEVGNQIHSRLVEMLLQAETDGRVAWRGKGGNSYEELNVLLTNNNLPELQLPTNCRTNYSYPQVQELVVEQYPGVLQAIWRG